MKTCSPARTLGVLIEVDLHRGRPRETSPAVVNNVVYIGSDDYSLYALNATTGKKLWSFPTGDYVSTSAAVANGVVYFGSFDNKVYALNASTGAKLWMHACGNAWSELVVAGGVVYFGSTDGYIYALNASTGVSWGLAHHLSDKFRTPSGRGRRSSIRRILRRLSYAFDAMTGAQLWNARVRRSAFPSSGSRRRGLFWWARHQRQRICGERQ